MVANQSGKRRVLWGKVVVKKSEFIHGEPTELRPGVKDIKIIYPETGMPTKSLVMGIAEVKAGYHSPRTKHNCEEVYYILEGTGEIESDGTRHSFKAGDAVLNRENVPHRVFNTGNKTLRMLVVGGIMFCALLPEWPTESPYVIEPEDI